jgi:tRNA pseudouridine65 synthase
LATSDLLDVLYRDEHLVAINKPSGLLVHRTNIASDRVALVQLLRDQLGRRVYPVHRLDRGTSGALLFALSPESAARLIRAFENRAVAKSYVAVVRGFVDAEGEIDYPLAEEEGRPRQPAVTRYRRLSTVELPVAVSREASTRYALVEACPHTGRMHQVRRHFKHIAHPVIGDTVHGDGRHNRFFRDWFGVHRLLLHARRIEFEHPFGRGPLTVEAPLPGPLRGLFALFGWA